MEKAILRKLDLIIISLKRKQITRVEDIIILLDDLYENIQNSLEE